MALAPEPDAFDVALICPLKLEVDAARGAFTQIYDIDSQDYKKKHDLSGLDTNIYYFGKIHQFNVILCQPAEDGGGQIVAYDAYNTLAYHFRRIVYLFLVGVAGGVPRPSNDPDVRVGDVVLGLPSKGNAGVTQIDGGWQIGTSLPRLTTSLNSPQRDLRHAAEQVRLDHETSGSDKAYRLAQIVERIRNNLPADARLRTGLSWAYPGRERDVLFSPKYACQSRDNARDAANWCPAACDTTRVLDRPSRENKAQTVHKGLICSLGRVVKNDEWRDKIVDQVYKEQDRAEILCFEMEGCGIAEYTQCLQVRGICDYSDTHKTKVWQPYAALQAAGVVRLILEHLSASHYQGRVRRNSENNSSRSNESVFKKESSVNNDTSQDLSPAKSYGSRFSEPELEWQDDYSGSSKPNNNWNKVSRPSTPSEKEVIEIERVSTVLSATDMGRTCPSFYKSTRNFPKKIASRKCKFKLYLGELDKSKSFPCFKTNKFGDFDADWCIQEYGLGSDIMTKRLSFHLKDTGDHIRFWIPADGVFFFMPNDSTEPEYIYKWSDCESFDIKGKNYWRCPYYCYNASNPNIKLRIVFDDPHEEEYFRKSMMDHDLSSSDWQLQSTLHCVDHEGRHIRLYKKQRTPDRVLITAHQTNEQVSSLKFYRVKKTFNLSADTAVDQTIFTIHGLEVLNYCTEELEVEEEIRYQRQSKEGTPTTQKWATQEAHPFLSQKGSSLLPSIRLDYNALRQVLQIVLSWNLEHYTDRSSFKVKKWHDNSLIFFGSSKEFNGCHFFCYAIKNETWSILQVERGQAIVRDGNHMRLRISKWSTTQTLQIDQLGNLDKGPTILEIKFADSHECNAIRNRLHNDQAQASQSK